MSQTKQFVRPPLADFFGFFGALKKGTFLGSKPKKSGVGSSASGVGKLENAKTRSRKAFCRRLFPRFFCPSHSFDAERRAQCPPHSQPTFLASEQKNSTSTKLFSTQAILIGLLFGNRIHRVYNLARQEFWGSRRLLPACIALQKATKELPQFPLAASCRTRDAGQLALRRACLVMPRQRPTEAALAGPAG
jgi:hypothetical protein